MPTGRFTSAAHDSVQGFSLREEYGGDGAQGFHFNAVLNEDLGRSAISSGAVGVALSNDIVFPHFTDLISDEQRARWLPERLSISSRVDSDGLVTLSPDLAQ